MRTRTIYPWAALLYSCFALSAHAGDFLAIDTTPAWGGIGFSGDDAVGQVITAPASGALLTAFEFFALPPTDPFVGGIFEWDDTNGVVIGQALASVAAIPPVTFPPPPNGPISGARVRFVLPMPVPLQANKKYLLFAESTFPRPFTPIWLITLDSYPFGVAKEIFPPNGTVTGPWTTVTSLSPGPDDWAIRVFFAAPVAAAIPAESRLTLGGLVLLLAVLGAFGILRRQRHSL
jgi:hypothetical protein